MGDQRPRPYRLAPDKVAAAQRALEAATPTEAVYAGTQGGGVFRSTDSGTSWSAVNTGLTDLFVWALLIDPITTSTLYAGGNSGIFRSANGGDTRTLVNAGLTTSVINVLAIDPITPTTLYAGTYWGGVFRSTDGVDNWRAINAGLTDLLISALAVDPITPTIVHAATRSGVFSIDLPPPCAGDCNADGQVVIDELLTLVSITLDDALPSACRRGVPDDTRVDVAFVVRAVSDTLGECSGG